MKTTSVPFSNKGYLVHFCLLEPECLHVRHDLMTNPNFWGQRGQQSREVVLSLSPLAGRLRGSDWSRVPQLAGAEPGLRRPVCTSIHSGPHRRVVSGVCWSFWDDRCGPVTAVRLPVPPGQGTVFSPFKSSKETFQPHRYEQTNSQLQKRPTLLNYLTTEGKE